MYKAGDKAFIEVDIVFDGDEKSYCFPNIKSKVYECRVKGLTHEDNKLMYFSEKQLVSSPIVEIQERLETSNGSVEILKNEKDMRWALGFAVGQKKAYEEVLKMFGIGE